MNPIPSVPNFDSRPRWWLLWFILLSPSWLHAEPTEYQVKAGFLYNFAKFVEWPTPTAASSPDLRISIWAPDIPSEIILGTLVGKKLGRRDIVATRFDTAQPSPHILFVHEQSEPIPSELLRRLSADHVLLVGESSGFASRYGVIGFILRDNNLRLQINLAAAERAQIRLSGQLARLAETVKDLP